VWLIEWTTIKIFPIENHKFSYEIVKVIFARSLSRPGFGRNEFFHWLNDSDSEMNDFMSSDEVIFMNCVDFVYLILFLNNLMSKKAIINLYQKQIKDESNYYYGFNIDRFNDFDAIKGNPNEKPKPGDLLIGYEKNKPVHILFLTGRNPTTGEWKGMGLWNMGTKKLTPSNLELTKLQKDFEQYNERNPLSFKYCSLETALDSLTQVD
ncbi:MAG: hypothetical protein KR126chlam3_00778, partial [Chlamydiae bacterium]|nr:hypothetical protein [Chlamydiota bacterium]